MLISRKREGIISFLIFLTAFAPRFAAWIYPRFGWGNLAIYDVQLYTDFGEQMVKAALGLELRKLASINVGVPPLGTFLVGVSVYAFGGILGKYQASFLAPIIASSFTSVIIYLSLARLERKMALMASLLFSLDPYLIQFSVVYLDAIGALFAMIGMWMFLSSKSLSLSKSMLIGIFLGLSILVKFYFLVFTAFLVLLLMVIKKAYKQAVVVMVFSLTFLAGIPWMWFSDSLGSAIIHNISMNSVLPPILFGPLMIGVPESYPWYFLTYFGLGQVHWKVMPSISHFFLFLMLVYCYAQGKVDIDSRIILMSAAAILSTAFIPRNYWTYSWAMGIVKSGEVLIKQFYPYYFYFTNLMSGIIASGLWFRSPEVEEPSSFKVLLFIVTLFAMTSPFVMIFNLGYPYWDFIFTLILNYSQGNPLMASHGLTALILTTTIVASVWFFSLKIVRKIKLIMKGGS